MSLQFLLMPFISHFSNIMFFIIISMFFKFLYFLGKMIYILIFCKDYLRKVFKFCKDFFDAFIIIIDVNMIKWTPFTKFSACEVVFLWGYIPLMLYSGEVMFLWGCLPARLSLYLPVLLVINSVWGKFNQSYSL